MKTRISLLLLGLICGSAYAGHAEETPMPISNDINVTAPDQSGMWSFGATAVLMQPTNKTFNYAIDAPIGVFGSGPVPNGEIGHPDVTDGYYWWFGADITYAFPGNGRDVTLAYEGLHGSDSDSTNADGLAFLNSSFSGSTFLNAAGKTETNYDAGDLVFGQKIDVGQRVRLHPFAGLRYAYINTKDTGNYTGSAEFDGEVLVPTDPQRPETGKLDNTFSGIGPRFGSDAQVNLGQGFSVRGRLGLSALIGSHKIDNAVSFTLDDTAGDVADTGTVTLDDQSQTRVIPEIDGRLGLNYTYTFDSATALGFELGWQATNYFNVISDQPLINDLIPGGGGGGGASPGTHYSSTSNFGMQGPYARLQLDIA